MGFLRDFIKTMAGRGDAPELSLELPDEPTPEAIDHAICLLHDRRNYWAVGPWLRHHIAQVRPVLEQVYQSGDLPEQPLVKAGSNDMGIRQSVINLLVFAGSDVASNEILQHWNAQEQPRVVAGWAAELATPAMAEVISEALELDEPFVGYEAVRALARAQRRSGLPPEIKEAAYSRIKSFLTRPLTAGAAAGLMVKIDRKRAILDLTDSAVLCPENEAFGTIVNALREQDVAQDFERLISLYRELERSTLKNRIKLQSMGEIVQTLAVQRYACTLEMVAGFRRATADEPWCRYHANAAMEAWHGIDPVGVLNALDPHLQYRSLNHHQMVYATVVALLGQVGNGGFAQYFSNPYGDHAWDALAGLRELRMTEAAELLDREMQRFGPEGPSPDRQIRNQQLDAMLDDDEDTMEEGEDTSGRLCRIAPDVYDALTEYAIGHREHFTLNGPTHLPEK